jgi:hypothetical protein
MGNLAEAIAGISARRRGPQCTVSVILEKLAPPDRKDLATVLEDHSVSSQIVSQGILAAFELKVSQHTIGRHRRGDCLCQD